MDRTVFYTRETIIDQITGRSTEELDYLYNNLSKFRMNYPPAYYRVASSDLYRPDTISSTNYGTVDYWWVILYINGIHDPFNDLVVGQLLTIPNVLDIYDFWKKYRVVKT